jgi:subtilisin family serine protease
MTFRRETKLVVMKHKSWFLRAVSTLICAAAINVAGETNQPYAVPGRYIVVLKHGHAAADVAHGHGVKPNHTFKHALNGFAGAISTEQLEALRQDPRVELIEPELQVFASAQTIPSGVKRIGATLSATAKIDGLDERVNADIAILDTGIAPHPDLNIYTNVSFIYGQSTDGHGHGTHVAGIAAALDNTVGVVGVAPGARLWAIKVLDDTGGGTTATIIQGIDFVTQNAAQIEVANLSLGGIGYSATFRAALSNSVAKGVVYVVAAGNDHRDIYGTDGIAGTADDSIPASFPEVMSISALSDIDGVASSDDALANFSNFSRSVASGAPVNSPGAGIDLAAPGVNISSTYLNGGYATMSGTSMASPHAAGDVALYVAEHGRATSAAGVYAIRQALINSAQPQSAWGSANALDPDANHEGLVYLAGVAQPSNSAPSLTISSPANGATVPYNSTVTFSATASDTQDGIITSKVVWTENGVQITTGGSFSKTLSTGTHYITASVTDAGGKTTSTSVSVTVVSNNRPTVTITAPTANASFNSGSAISFSGSANDTEDGSLSAQVKWTSSINGQFGIGPSVSTSALSAGTHIITATATDSAGLAGSVSVTITVASVTAPPPTLVVQVGTDKASYVNHDKAYVTATVTDGVKAVSGAAAHLELRTSNGTVVTSDSTTDTSGRVVFQYPINKRFGTGTYSATVTVSKTGYNSASASSTFNVTR